MKPLSDQTLARRMLETRERDYSIHLFVRRNTKTLLFLFSYYIFAVVVLALLRLWTLFWVMLGMVAGCLFRDIGWFRSHRNVWPFTLKVTDWGAVQRLAEE